MIIPIEIVVVILSSLLTALGFLVVVLINAFGKNTEAFKSINDSIEAIRIWMAKKDTENIFEDKQCGQLHQQINNRFEQHDKRITTLEKK